MKVQMCDKEAKTSNSSSSANTNFVGEAIPSIIFLNGGDQYVLDCLSDIQSMEAIAYEWQYLENNCGEPFIYFQSYDWCHQWCKNYVTSDNTSDLLAHANYSPCALRIYVLRRNSELVMIWPMMIRKLNVAGITAQTFLSDPHGQYSNVICNRSLLPLDVGKTIWNHIREATKADTITLDQYPQSSFLRQMVEGDGLVERSKRHSSILDLKAFASWEEHLASLDAKSRKQRNRRRRKLEKHGEVDYQVFYGGSAQYNELAALALKWKKLWLRNTARRDAVISQALTRKFLCSLSGNQNNVDKLPSGAVLGALMLDGKPIAIEIGMCLDGHYYSYLGAFDWQHRPLSPGKIQIEEMQKWAMEVGLKKFDFLGDPAEYKSEWTNSHDALESRNVSTTLRGVLYCVSWKAYLRPVARFLFTKLDADMRSKILIILGIRKNTTESDDELDAPITANYPVAVNADARMAKKFPKL